MTTKLFLSSIFALSLAACGSDSDPASNSPPTLTVSQSVASTEHCPNGGTEQSTGSDSNGNGVLDSSEITSTTYDCKDNPSSSDFHDCTGDTCKLYGRIEKHFTLTADKNWLITEHVLVGNGDRRLMNADDVAQVKADGVTLTIEPGTHIRALDDTSLTITRGSKIMAAGTPDAPIIFSENDGNATWDGLIIQGLAPVYPEDEYIQNEESGEYTHTEQGVCGDASMPCNMEVCEDKPFYCPVESGMEQYYGGNDLQDNSGVLSYIVLSRPLRYRNYGRALNLLGTGSHTQIDHIQIDGFSFMNISGGGTNISNLFMVQYQANEYSGVRLTINQGYKGNLQHIILSGLRTGYPTNTEIDIEGNETEVSISNLLLPHMNSTSSGISLLNSPSVNIYNSLIFTSIGCHDYKISQAINYQNILDTCSQDDLSDKITGDYPLITESGALNREIDIAKVTPKVVDNGSNFTFTETNYLGPVEYGTALEDVWWQPWVNDRQAYNLESPETLGEHLKQPNFVSCNIEMTSCSIVDDIDQDYTVKAAISWTLRYTVNVGNQQGYEQPKSRQAESTSPVTLTIEPGSNIFLATYSSLIINKGARLIAKGTSEKPIVFSSNRYNHPRGVVIQGDNDSEGNGNILSYAIFKDMGFYNAEWTIRKYHPALTLNNVGHNAKVNHIQIDHAQLHENHSGFLINGGSVNLENIVTTHSGGITLADGYKGNVQNLINIGQRSFIQTQAAEGDSAFTGQASISNFLAIGTDTSNTLIKMGKHSEVRLNNGVLSDLSGTTSPCITIDDGSSATPSQLHLLNVMDDCQAGLLDPVRAPDSSAGVVDVSESGLALSITDTGSVANSDITAVDLPEIDNGSGFRFNNTDYMGAVKPGTAKEDAWWYGWTVPGSLDELAN